MAHMQELSESAVSALPYRLTASQQRCVAEILHDLAQPVPMLRLLQGDVGSGKTAVAFIAALTAVASGYQVAVLVPNEVLAAQHERFMAATSANMPPEHRPVVEVLAGKVGVKCAAPSRSCCLCLRSSPQTTFSDLSLMTSPPLSAHVPLSAFTQCERAPCVSCPVGTQSGDVRRPWRCRRRRNLRKRLAAGDVDIVIGTTALNNDDELFSSLGLVIIDEQHRFGVRQRAQLVKKAPDAPPPHTLFMTATPIPRTIAMTLMSHMTTSVIDELPPGRIPVR